MERVRGVNKLERGGREELVVERARDPGCKVLVVGREGGKEGVEVVGDVVVEEYLEFDVFGADFWTDSSMFCMAKKVFGPTEHPKSAIENVFEDAVRACTSSFEAMASLINSFEVLDAALCKVSKICIWLLKED